VGGKGGVTHFYPLDAGIGETKGNRKKRGNQGFFYPALVIRKRKKGPLKDRNRRGRRKRGGGPFYLTSLSLARSGKREGKSIRLKGRGKGASFRLLTKKEGKREGERRKGEGSLYSPLIFSK